MSREQRVRAFLFYLSVFVFLIGLPLILSFALGYKFNPRTFKFTKAGIIALKTQPGGASIYLEGKLLNEKTPASINELLPGNYNIRLELEKYYPWTSDASVEAGKVTRLEKIILFPLRPNIKQLNKGKISAFWVDLDKGRVYYINQEESLLYKSDLEGENFEEIASLPEIAPLPRKWKISPDRDKLLFFSVHQITVFGLGEKNGLYLTNAPLIFNYSDRAITDVFWHSDSYHIILVTNRNIEVMEASPKAEAINLVNLNKKNISSFYDDNTDTLYFVDSQRAADGKFYDNVYKLELGRRFYPFKELIKPKTHEQ